MDDIIRKQMKDVTVPQNDVIRRPPAPLLPKLSVNDNTENRIDDNPFFEKQRGFKSALATKKPIGDIRSILRSIFFVLLLVAGFLVANYYASATIEVTPIERGVVLNGHFTAFKEAVDDNLVFNTVIFSDEKSKNVSATIEKKIQKKASGKIVIFNGYSKDSQRLIKNTRLESKDHKIFRIEQSVVVPGAKIVSGKIVEPGKVEVIAYADATGEEYNIGLTNFTIPGFKGDPRFSKFYALSCKTSSESSEQICSDDSPISGGFSGTVKVPSEEEVIKAKKELKEELKKTLVERARADINENSAFFPGSMIIKFEEVPEDFSTGETSKVAMRATVSVFFFDTNSLTKVLASSALPDESNKQFVIKNMSALAFAFNDPVDNVVLSDLTKISFSVDGPAEFIGNIDSQKIATALAGKSKKDFKKIITEQNNIKNANATIRPMWRSAFPEDPKKITVKIISE